MNGSDNDLKEHYFIYMYVVNYNKRFCFSSSLPPCHKLLSPSGKMTLFALEKYDLKKLAWRSGKIET